MRQRLQTAILTLGYRLLLLPLAGLLLLLLPKLAQLWLLGQLDSAWSITEFNLNLIHLPFGLYLLLCPWRPRLAQGLLLGWFFLTALVRGMEAGLMLVFGLGFSPLVFSNLDGESVAIALQQEPEKFALGFGYLFAATYLLKTLLPRTPLQGKSRQWLPLLTLLLLLHSSSYLATQAWRAHRYLPELSLGQQWQSYQEARRLRENLRLSPTEVAIAAGWGIRLEPAQVLPPAQASLNLIWIFLESFQHNFLDPVVTPNLWRFQAQHPLPTTLYQSVSPTINAEISAECGLWPDLDNRAVTGPDAGYSQGLQCLGDILKQAGYYQGYLSGYPVEFSGTAAFRRMHGSNEVVGREELFQTYPELAQRRHAWGVQDQDLVEQLIRRLQSPPATPFRWTMFLTNTHSPGFTGPACPALPGEPHPYFQAIHCTDAAFGRFWTWFAQSPLAANTLVVVVADHSSLLPKDKRLAPLRPSPRRLFFGLYDPLNRQSQLAKAGSMTDLGPTLLELLGFQVNSFRAGVSLLSGRKQYPAVLTPNLVIQDGKEAPQAECPSADLAHWTLQPGLAPRSCDLAKLRIALEHLQPQAQRPQP